MTILETNEAGDTVADLSPEQKRRKAGEELLKQLADVERLASSPRFNAPRQFPTGEISRDAEERTLPVPGTEQQKGESRKLAAAGSRYNTLSAHVRMFCERLMAWDAQGVATLAEDALAAWRRLGDELHAMSLAGAQPKVTPRSRMRLWLRPGKLVELREDIAAICAKMYSPEELGSLEVMAVLETKVALRVTGGRELGLVELAHVQKPAK